ncbi:MAG: CBS domain-containing protein [Chitinophagaceae bacterium]|jgi:CBS domain-containing protein|nr:CBS domain-containing protein [Chitinophagaceae bacterium]
MFNQALISVPAAPLSSGDTVADALNQLEDLRVSHWPVADEGIFKGLISEETLMDSDEGLQLKDLYPELLPFSVLADEYFISAVRMVTERKLDLVPVLSPEGEYLGVITQAELLQKMALICGTHTPGGLIVLEVNPHDYSPGEISRLIETNNAQLTQLNSSFEPATGLYHIIIRINKQEISDIIATFQRYDYRVVYYAGEEQYENELKRNFHHLLHFLEM